METIFKVLGVKTDVWLSSCWLWGRTAITGSGSRLDEVATIHENDDNNCFQMNTIDDGICADGFIDYSMWSRQELTGQQS